MDPETAHAIAHGFRRCPVTERWGVAVRRCLRADDPHTDHFFGPWVIGNLQPKSSGRVANPDVEHICEHH
jgi:hypothetical protein